jgi:hypothetical protein
MNKTKLISELEQADFIKSALAQFYDSVDLFLAKSEEPSSYLVISVIYVSVLLTTAIKSSIIEDKQMEVFNAALDEIRDKFILSGKLFNSI